MGLSRNLREFGTRMRVIARGVRDETQKIVRKAALVCDQVAVMATPVDTGRARANWIASIIAPADGIKDPDKSGGAALEQGAAVIGSYNIDFGSIYLTNNVPYIVPLENGHSRQAPQGMAKQAVAAGAEVVRGSKLLGGSSGSSTPRAPSAAAPPASGGPRRDPKTGRFVRGS
jgi:hypothetical protein